MKAPRSFRPAPKRLWIALLAVCLTALLSIAWLQYRWIGEVAVAERERIRDHLMTSTMRLREDFNREIMQLVRALSSAPGFYPDESDTDLLARRFNGLSEYGGDPAMIHELLLYRPNADGEFELLRFDRESRSFQEASGRLNELRERLAAGRDGFPMGMPLVGPNGFPALSLPLGRPRFEREPRRDGPPLRGSWVLVEIDSDYVVHTLIPDLVRRHFSDPTSSGFALQITGFDGQTLFTSDPELGPEFFGNPDAIAHLALTLPLRRPGPGIPRGREAVFDGMVEHRRRPPREEQGQPTWTLVVKHRAGSLENAVQRARIRNLGVSFAGLAILGVSIGILLVTTQRAQRLARQQMEFVAGVSHELRTPLSVICSAGDNLAEGVVSTGDHVKRYGAVIRNEGRRLSKMVEQVLRFAGIQSGRAKVNMDPVDVGSIVNAAVSACEHEIRSASCAVDVDVPQDLPQVKGDSVLLTHCLRNLVDNAATHGGRGGWIGITARRVDNSIEIAVQDRGPGIDNSERQRLFEPFFRGRTAHESHVRGFGLGLALAADIATAHAGSLTSASAPGEGARFTLRIPIATPA